MVNIVLVKHKRVIKATDNVEGEARPDSKFTFRVRATNIVLACPATVFFADFLPPAVGMNKRVHR